MACIVWLAGCNMRCQYCYNPEMLTFSSATKTEQHDLIPFLKTRIGLLDAVVLSGGEATLYPNILQLCKDIKQLGFKIKLDTNGTKPHIVKELLDDNLLDFVALDIKASTDTKVQEITDSRTLPLTLQTLNLLSDSTIPYECRTTVHSDLFTEQDILDCISLSYKHGYRGTYGLQLTMVGVPTVKEMFATEQFDITTIQANSALPIDFRNFES